MYGGSALRILSHAGTAGSGEAGLAGCWMLGLLCTGSGGSWSGWVPDGLGAGRRGYCWESDPACFDSLERNGGSVSLTQYIPAPISRMET